MSKTLPLLRTCVLALALNSWGANAAYADVRDGVDEWTAGNYAAAVKQWQPYVDKGDPDAEFNLGQAYKMGRGVPMDLAKAETLYGRAAAKGHLQAADAYGLLVFQRGDHARALPYIEASAARGEARGQYILGVAHFNGDVVAKDWVRAYALVSLAQQAGLPQATPALAQMDQYIPISDRQKAVAISAQIAAQTQAYRHRLNTSAALDTHAADEPVPSINSLKPENAGADYTHLYASNANVPRPAGAAPVGRGTPPTTVATLPRPAVAVAAAAANPTSAAPRPEPASSQRPPTPVAVVKRPTAPPRAHAPAPGPWRIQLGAFGVAANADALWARIKGKPELAGRSKALVRAGNLTKLHATGFSTKAEADSACDRLSRGGVSCMTVRN